MDFANIIAAFNRLLCKHQKFIVHYRSQMQKAFNDPSKTRRISKSEKGDGRGEEEQPNRKKRTSQ
jgi:hypothetical protein